MTKVGLMFSLGEETTVVRLQVTVLPRVEGNLRVKASFVWIFSPLHERRSQVNGGKRGQNQNATILEAVSHQYEEITHLVDLQGTSSYSKLMSSQIFIVYNAIQFLVLMDSADLEYQIVDHYPKDMPLLANILESLVSHGNDEDNIHSNKEKKMEANVIN
ncbi:hypothetical protein NE237_027598 [Protea cynaroides]|uniref:Uncharacterized protein n=1 Tax=Protea cynaroides TaxID=273540 RepID=A0A9Q0GMU8_9MAGN|nr:hypothetical protein NE237_027598 [Protea cynaroides]